MRKAFTLIELLVTVAIIGILAVLVTINLNDARTSSRDARRQTDIKNYTAALEKYHINSGSYFVTDKGGCDNPIAAATPGCVGAEGASYGRMNLKSATEVEKPYGSTTIAQALLSQGLIDKIAKDPSNNKDDTTPGQSDYVLIRCNQDGTQAFGRTDAGFAIWTHLEKAPNTVSVENSGSSCGGSPSFGDIFASSQVKEILGSGSGTRMGEATSGYVAAGGGLIHAIAGRGTDSSNTERTPSYAPEVTPTPGRTSVFIVGPAAKKEGNSGTNTQVEVELKLTKPLHEPATIDWTTIDGTDDDTNHAATVADNDYEKAFGTATFAVGESSIKIPISIIGDDTLEPDETFGVMITAASSNLVVKNMYAVVTILNDDADGYNGGGSTGQACTEGSAFTGSLSVPYHKSASYSGTAHKSHFTAHIGASSVAEFNTKQTEGATLKITSFGLDDIAIIVKEDIKISDILSIKKRRSLFRELEDRTITIPPDSFIIYDSDKKNFSGGKVNDAANTTYLFGNKSYFIPGGKDKTIKDLDIRLGLPMLPYDQINLITLSQHGYWNSETGRLAFKVLHVAHGSGYVTLKYQVDPCK